MAPRSRVISIDLELEARDDDVVVVTFNRLCASESLLKAHSYALLYGNSETRLNDLLAKDQVLIYDCIVSRRGRTRLHVDVSQLTKKLRHICDTEI